LGEDNQSFGEDNQPLSEDNQPLVEDNQSLVVFNQKYFFPLFHDFRHSAFRAKKECRSRRVETGRALLVFKWYVSKGLLLSSSV
jgi:hypothetical protein